MATAIKKQAKAMESQTTAIEKQASAIEAQTAAQINHTRNFCDAMKDQNRLLKRIAEALESQGQGSGVLGTDACWDHDRRDFDRMWYGHASPSNPRHWLWLQAYEPPTTTL